MPDTTDRDLRAQEYEMSDDEKAARIALGVAHSVGSAVVGIFTGGQGKGLTDAIGGLQDLGLDAIFASRRKKEEEK